MKKKVLTSEPPTTLSSNSSSPKGLSLFFFDFSRLSLNFGLVRTILVRPYQEGRGEPMQEEQPANSATIEKAFFPNTSVYNVF